MYNYLIDKILINNTTINIKFSIRRLDGYDERKNFSSTIETADKIAPKSHATSVYISLDCYVNRQKKTIEKSHGNVKNAINRLSRLYFS